MLLLQLEEQILSEFTPLLVRLLEVEVYVELDGVDFVLKMIRQPPLHVQVLLFFVIASLAFH